MTQLRARLLLAGLVLVGWTACGREPHEDTVEPQEPDELALAREQVADLEKDRHYLEERIDHQEKFLAAYGAKMNGILDNLRTIAGEEDQVLAISQAMELETGYRQASAREIDEIMASIATRLEESRDAERDLRELLAEAVAETGELEGHVSELQRSVDALRRLVEEKQVRIGELEVEIAGLMEELKAQAAHIRHLEESGYLLVADGKRLSGLKRDNVLRRGRMFRKYLELTPAALGSGAYEATFERVDVTAREHVLDAEAPGAELRSVHRRFPDLVELGSRDGKLLVRIRDPERFWRISRFLIVKVR